MERTEVSEGCGTEEEDADVLSAVVAGKQVEALVCLEDGCFVLEFTDDTALLMAPRQDAIFLGLAATTALAAKQLQMEVEQKMNPN